MVAMIQQQVALWVSSLAAEMERRPPPKPKPKLITILKSGSPLNARIIVNGCMVKFSVSVLVVIHTADGQVLLMERADAPGFWQSVTGSQDEGETLEQTAIREVHEETGLDAAQFELDAVGHFNPLRDL